ncbi:MAG: MBL fold metallo-hydrolase, partial [Candidatus Limnocylindria bacterium]
MEIAPGVHQVRMLGADAFLIAEERLTLIDAGMVGSRRTLERYLRGIGRRLDDLERIICTHGHPDHIGGVSELVRDRDDVTVLIHPDDLAGLRLPLREALARTVAVAARRGRLIQY